jgi:LmbE family N-acetylglucosaminyl deacetylase
MSLRTQNSGSSKERNSKRVAVIVAHPDDETLWAGGTILSHPSWKWFVVCLCRGSDIDRAPRFLKTLQILGSDGVMGDLDDGPEQKPLDEAELEQTILKLLPAEHFDLIISHNPGGEYTRHIRHEETGKAVIKLWNAGKIYAKELWTFAYEDGDNKYFPRAVRNATICNALAEQIWLNKYRIITETYGFEKPSFEAETTPRTESFWQFTYPSDAQKWLKQF